MREGDKEKRKNRRGEGNRREEIREEGRREVASKSNATHRDPLGTAFVNPRDIAAPDSVSAPATHADEPEGVAANLPRDAFGDARKPPKAPLVLLRMHKENTSMITYVVY